MLDAQFVKYYNKTFFDRQNSGCRHLINQTRTGVQAYFECVMLKVQLFKEGSKYHSRLLK